MSKPGQVVYIRVNPTNCMSCVDVVDKLGYKNTPDLSFDTVVSVALSAALELLREHSIIPRRDGFEYTQLVTERFTTNRTKRKLQTTEAISTQLRPQLLQPLAESPQVKRIKLRLQELKFKMQADPDNMPQEELDELGEKADELAKLGIFEV